MSPLAKKSALITGFPGFLAHRLLLELATEGDAPIYVLSLPDTLVAARREINELEKKAPRLEGRVKLVSGDITRKRLGMDPRLYEELLKEVGVVWHLAALYDLAVEAQIAYRVNLGGTYEVLDFCEKCTGLERFNHISTCYVSGTRRGKILESELDCGQDHHNHYEATKFWSEVEVQRRMKDLPTTVLRPGIVVGDSQTGTTAKYDGPYFIFQLLHRLPKWLPFPNIGRGDTVVNLVPVDFVAQSMSYLGLHGDATGKVLHLAAPHPMTAKQIVDAVLRHFEHDPARGQIPASWVERALENQLIQEWTGIPPEALAYFNHDAHYDTTEASALLSQGGISCPHLSTYLPTLLDTFLRFPDGPPPLSKTV